MDEKINETKKITLERFSVLNGYESEPQYDTEYIQVKPHPFLANEFRIRYEFFCEGVNKVCIYSKCNSEGELLSSKKSGHRNIHCCVKYEGNFCEQDIRLDNIDSIEHDCFGDNLQSLKIQLSSDSIIDALEDLHKVHGLPFEVCISFQMIGVIKTSLRLKKTFPDESPESFQSKITIYKLKEKMVQKAYQKCIERPRLFYNKKRTLILDAEMKSHIHVVRICLAHPLISPEPTLLSIYTGLCTADRFSRLVAQTALNLQQFKIGVDIATTDGGSSFTSALTPLSKQNYSRFLPKGCQNQFKTDVLIICLTELQKMLLICITTLMLWQQSWMKIQVHYIHNRILKNLVFIQRLIVKQDGLECFLLLSNYEPWLSFTKKFCMNIFFYFFGDDRKDLFACAFAFSYSGKKLMELRNLGMISSTSQSFKLTFGSMNYVSVIIPPLLFFDIKSIQIPQKPDKYLEHRILKQKVENAYQLAISQIQIPDPTAPCFIPVQKIIWYSSTPIHNQIITGKSGIGSPTATFLTSTIDDLEQEQEVQLIYQMLNDEELMQSQYFANEAVLFWAGKYGDMDDEMLIDNQIGYWQGQNKSNPMMKVFIDFTNSVLAFPSSDAGIERKFSQAKRFIGIGGQRVSLQTLFCELA
ncbi:MAG: hypothetical protein EZS28_001254 [Streblomastix strix]|uniref:Uncharacterized protein n=1 Tax=Streblomastix strix TaxID=222440 RepID=A0A5J4X7L3_9EUKA|nr:MAG: hypothetical protein EZS28_001254 [Streblomastix strix]